MLKRVLLSTTSLSLLLFTAALHAQTGVGQIQGTVNDASGAVIPNASVSLQHVQTANKFDTKTSSVGFFVFPSLQSGDYKLTISAPGLQKWEGQVLLRVGQQAVINASLHISRAAEQVTVVGDVTQLLTTHSPTIATLDEPASIEQLPLNGRSIQNLLTITVPGLEGPVSQPRVYGLRDSAMEFNQDGVQLDDRNTGNIQARPPGLDTI